MEVDPLIYAGAVIFGRAAFLALIYAGIVIAARWFYNELKG